MAVQVIHEMLLQTCRSQYQIFPALPAEWTDLSFSGLYGEGGIKISAELKNGKISSLILEGSCNSKIVLWNPARKDEILFLNGTQVQWENGKIALTFMPGTRYEFYA